MTAPDAMAAVFGGLEAIFEETEGATLRLSRSSFLKLKIIRGDPLCGGPEATHGFYAF